MMSSRAASLTLAFLILPAAARAQSAPVQQAARIGAIAAGTDFVLASSSRICTNTNTVGDNFDATATEARPGTNGVSVPPGAVVHFTITQLKRSDSAKSPIVIELRTNSVSFGGKTYNLEASVIDAEVVRIREGSKDTVRMSAAELAWIGLVTVATKGRNFTHPDGKSAAAAKAPRAPMAPAAIYQGCISQGARLVIVLDAPLTLAAPSAPAPAPQPVVVPGSLASIDGSITGIKFYEQGDVDPPSPSYNDAFARDSRFIVAEITLKHRELTAATTLKLSCEYVHAGPPEKSVGKLVIDPEIEPGANGSTVSKGLGVSGQWKPGTYRVSCVDAAGQSTQATFTIR
jgi:hypothetical protein